jgi:hypothetical protein
MKFGFALAKFSAILEAAADGPVAIDGNQPRKRGVQRSIRLPSSSLSSSW